MRFLLVVLSFVVAEEVVELEPVRDLYGKYNCEHWTSPSNQATCVTKPFCVWSASGCRDDTCLIAAGDDWSGDGDCLTATGNSSCHLYSTNINYLDPSGGCTDPANPVYLQRKVCRFGTDRSVVDVDSCTFEYLKSGKTTCDKWLCTDGATDTAGTPYCGANSPPDPDLGASCSSIKTAAWCALSPKCYWDSNCKEDLCTQYSTNCGGHHNSPDDTTGPVCSIFEIYDGSSATAGTTKMLCVDASVNAKPNKCYDLGAAGDNSATSANHPYTGTGLCRTYTLPRCSAVENCTAEFPTSGPFVSKGYYCADALHTSDAILMRVPYLLLLLLVAFFSF